MMLKPLLSADQGDLAGERAHPAPDVGGRHVVYIHVDGGGDSVRRAVPSAFEAVPGIDELTPAVENLGADACEVVIDVKTNTPGPRPIAENPFVAFVCDRVNPVLK